MATITLTWNDNASDETGQDISRRVNAGAWDDSFDSIAADLLTYDDTTANYTDQFDYRVRATNASGDSTWSNTAAAGFRKRGRFRTRIKAKVV